MIIQDIYDQYKIPEWLQLHMLRVAAVAQYICDHTTVELNQHAIVSACLLHDMGNIIKIPFETMQKLEPWAASGRSLEERRQIKKEFIEQYGMDECRATEIIAAEVTKNPSILELVNVTGYSKIQNNINTNHLPALICCYADMRVQPTGVVSLRERMEEAFERYKGVKYRATKDEFETSMLIVDELERRVFQFVRLRPEDITNDVVQKDGESLRTWEIL